MPQDSKKLIEELNKSSKKIRKEISTTPKGIVTEVTNKKKMTRGGIIIGFVTGIPLGLFVEIWRFMTAREWDGGFVALIITIIAVIVFTVAGYFYGAYMDGGT